MRPANRLHSLAPRVWAVLILATGLVLVACDSDVNVTGPEFPDAWPWPGSDKLRIYGSLTTEDGSCREARVFYDGQEVPLGQSRCLSEEPGACAKLDLGGSIPDSPGRHTIAFKVLRQSPAEVTYRAEGEVVLNGQYGLPRITFGPTQATLREGESVNFEIEVPKRTLGR